MRSLEGQVAWVTGAGRGLGRAAATALSLAGARVVLTSRTESELLTVLEEIRAAGGEGLALTGSVDDPQRVRAIVAEVEVRLGRLDVLVNAAGVSPTFTGAELVSDDEWAQVVAVNLTGTFTCCREAARMMLAAGRGSIINLSSIHAASGFGKLAAYSASKGAVEALTRALAVEWAPRGVRVNAVAPGYFATLMSEGLLASRWGERIVAEIPIGRVGKPEELVEAVLLLAGEGSCYMTGSVLTVDGGWTAR